MYNQQFGLKHTTAGKMASAAPQGGAAEGVVVFMLYFFNFHFQGG